MLTFENPALKTENLQVYYGDHHAFFDGNLEFERNRITALIVRVRQVNVFAQLEPHERQGRKRYR